MCWTYERLIAINVQLIWKTADVDGQRMHPDALSAIMEMTG
jgi:hypothetical protein